MKNKGFISVLLLHVLMIGVGCIFDDSLEGIKSVDQTSTPLPIIKSEPTPDYIYMLWPEPGSVELKYDYDKLLWYDNEQPGICIEFGTIALLEKGDFLSYEQLTGRFSIQVDETGIDHPSYTLPHDTEGFDLTDPETNEPLYYYPPGSPHFICFAIELDEGLHSATLIARKTSGNELAYSWSFVLIDVMPTVTPTVIPSEPEPEYIEYIFPEPGSVSTIKEYAEERWMGHPEPGICIYFRPFPTMGEPSEDLSIADVLDKLSLEIGDQIVEQPIYSEIDDIQVIGPNVSDQDMLSSTAPAARHVVCFEADLEEGFHTATLHFDKSLDEQLSYTWSFVLEP